MDFGSAGPITEPIHNRRQVLNIIDHASSHTTISYRPPELFEGGIRPSNSIGGALEVNECSNVVDFRCVDVWGLGCVLHAMLYGVPPSECDFARSDGRIQVLSDVSHLSVLRGIPRPPKHSTVSSWYSTELYTQLLEPMLHQDRMKRILLPAVLLVIEKIIIIHGGSVPSILMKHSMNGDRRFSGSVGMNSDDDDFV
jgi:serine/threonine protein kinase